MAKKKFSKRLNLSLIQARPQEELKVRQAADVPAHEFGEGFTVIVKGMTAADRHILGELNNRRMQHFHAPDMVDEDSNIVNDVPAPEFLFSSQCIMAALCAIDEEGNLVFGETPREAIRTVSELPAKYTNLIARIVVTAMELTAGAGVDDKTAVDKAEKN